MPQNAERTVRVRVRGRVQGVWYRGWTVERARALGLDGWVRNRADGSVEMVLSGRQAAVERMLEMCWQGPRTARVSEVFAEPARTPTAAGFRQCATA